jgi:hypothetical protein
MLDSYAHPFKHERHDAFTTQSIIVNITNTQLSEQAERYDEMVCLLVNASMLGAHADYHHLFVLLAIIIILLLNDLGKHAQVASMKEVAELDQELTIEERNLLSVAYKNIIVRCPSLSLPSSTVHSRPPPNPSPRPTVS